MKHSQSRSADFWRTFTLSLAAAGLLFGLGWLLISHNGIHITRLQRRKQLTHVVVLN